MDAREAYYKYPIWILYWWKAESVNRDSLDDFRKSIVEDEAQAKKHNRLVSSEPLIAAAKLIDKYRVK